MSDDADDKMGRDGLALIKCFLFELDDMSRAKLLSYARELALHSGRGRDPVTGPLIDKH